MFFIFGQTMEASQFTSMSPKVVLLKTEHLKPATKIALLILIRVSYRNSPIALARSRGRIKCPRNLKISAVLNFKERSFGLRVVAVAYLLTIVQKFLIQN